MQNELKSPFPFLGWFIVEAYRMKRCHCYRKESADDMGCMNAGNNIKE